ncbi:DUF6332 family protein [Streptomyces sp. NBC_00887]|uniref:DUF6332 family protein n=1 Tax=Streptomyces sp. NBC_00887 TaxID=2975859 RepID=UPI003864D10C|nr:DUF6332 family protein [Streptomyces sp. NBC_00887]WSY35720.1 DUF6332 family protein [Streptomyces sp. NBC_00887]
MGRRTQADRDAMTVEIGYALVSGALVAAATFAGIFLPALFLDLTSTGERVLFRIGAALGSLTFVVRVVHVLWRFPRAPHEQRVPSAQPSQPGRTSPDS